MSGKTGPWCGDGFSGWPAGESSSWAMGLSVLGVFVLSLIGAGVHVSVCSGPGIVVGRLFVEMPCVVDSCCPIVVPGVGNLEISSSLVALPRVGR